MLLVGAVLVAVGLGALVYGLAQMRVQVVTTTPIPADDPEIAEEAQASAPSVIYRTLEPLVKGAAAVMERLSPAGRLDLIRRRVVYAGMEGSLTPQRVAAYKAVVGSSLFVLGLTGSPIALPTPFWAIFLGAAGSILPDIWLDSRARERQAKVARDLPEALDLLAISVEAGLGLEQAIEVVTENLHGPLGEEFTRMLREIELGVSRRAALNELRSRTDVPELSSFVVALVQADQVGAPIAEVLRVQAEQVRLKRRQRAKEKAAQLPVKILFPLVLFIFPSLFVVTIGPGAINIMDNLLGNI